MSIKKAIKTKAEMNEEGMQDVEHGPGIVGKKEGDPIFEKDESAKEDVGHGPGVEPNKPAGATDEGSDKGPGIGYKMPEGNIHSDFKRK